MKPESNSSSSPAIGKYCASPRPLYVKPALVRYGDVAKLTAGSAGRRSDRMTKKQGFQFPGFP